MMEEEIQMTASFPDRHKHVPEKCPKCGNEPFVSFLRGIVARSSRPWYWPFKKRPPHAVICYQCKEIVAYEWERVIDFLGVKHLPEDVAEEVVHGRGKGTK